MNPIFKFMLFLPMIIFLIYITAKYGGTYLSKINNGRVIRVYERVPLGQNSFLTVVTIAGKPYVISNTQNEVKILLELKEEDLKVYEKILKGR